MTRTLTTAASARRNGLSATFAEGLGFWEVNIYRALTCFRADEWGSVSHRSYRERLAHALLTLGAPWGQAEGAGINDASEQDGHYCTLVRFEAYKNEKHQCGHCKEKAYFYCKRCFPDASSVEYATCNPATGRKCFAKHVLGVKPTHGCAAHVVHSPRLLAKRKAREEARASGGSGASASGGSGARPHAQRRV